MDKFLKILQNWNIDADDKKLLLFEKYYELLIEWNDRINLTAITDKEDVYIKHFADSLAPLLKLDLTDKRIMDVGTGAGFPGIPLKIMCPSCRVVLLDSLNKRIGFLNEVISALGLTDVETVHGRAEDLAHDDNYREKFDIVTSRAVAGLNVLSEYCIPFTDINGYFISYKSGRIDDEISLAENAVLSLGGCYDDIDRFVIPETDYKRSLVYILKKNHTDNKYPRKSGIPSKKPL